MKITRSKVIETCVREYGITPAIITEFYPEGLYNTPSCVYVSLHSEDYTRYVLLHKRAIEMKKLFTSHFTTVPSFAVVFIELGSINWNQAWYTGDERLLVHTGCSNTVSSLITLLLAEIAKVILVGYSVTDNTVHVYTSFSVLGRWRNKSTITRIINKVLPCVKVNVYANQVKKHTIPQRKGI